MTNVQAISMGFGMIAAAVLASNWAPPAISQSAGPVIPPVEGLVPAGDSGGTSGPWHLWRLNRHTGQISFCTAEVAAGQSGQGAPSKQPAAVAVDCTKTSAAM